MTAHASTVETEKSHFENASTIEATRSEQDEILQSYPLNEQKRLVRKIDFRLIPILFMLFLCAFIDRINIGNVKILGLEKSLHMNGNQFNVALFIFFVPYCLLEVPCNLILKRTNPRTWLSFIIFAWGVVTIGQGFCRSYASLVVCRFLLGVFEAGFYPGCVYLISMYYRRHELQLRVNIFFSASILAGAISGLLAYGIAHMNGISGYEGWRWIFILEGIFTVVVAIVSFFVIPDWPENARFLTHQERTFLIHRLAADSADAKMSVWSKKTGYRIFGDLKIYLGAAMYLGTVTTAYSTSFFTPTILRQMGYTSVSAQVMSIPIFVVAGVLSISTGLLADRLKHRFGFAILGCLITTVGFAVLLSMMSVPVGARYFALFAITSGSYITLPITIVWLSNNLAGHYKRAVGSAMQLGIGNTGGIIAGNIFLPKQAPTYPVGFGVGLGCVGLCVLSCVAFLYVLMRENRLRETGQRDYRLQETADELRNMGDDHPSFRFTY